MIPVREGGILKLYTLTDVSAPGFMPSEKLVYNCEYFYSKVTTGVTRRYAALGANRDYTMVVRLWHAFPSLPDTVRYAIDENGIQYRIDVADPVYDVDAIELTLVRLEDYYDVAIQT